MSQAGVLGLFLLQSDIRVSGRDSFLGCLLSFYFLFAWPLPAGHPLSWGAQVSLGQLLENYPHDVHVNYVSMRPSVEQRNGRSLLAGKRLPRVPVQI